MAGCRWLVHKSTSVGVAGCFGVVGRPCPLGCPPATAHRRRPGCPAERTPLRCERPPRTKAIVSSSTKLTSRVRSTRSQHLNPSFRTRGCHRASSPAPRAPSVSSAHANKLCSLCFGHPHSARRPSQPDRQGARHDAEAGERDQRGSDQTERACSTRPQRRARRRASTPVHVCTMPLATTCPPFFP